MTEHIWHPSFHLLASLTQQDLTREVSYLKEENKILRERLPDRVYTTETERKRLNKPRTSSCTLKTLLFLPELLMHDRDTKFTKEFAEIIKSTGCEIKMTPIMSPNLQAHVERVVRTLKHEVLNEFVVVSEKHLNQICREAQTWYNNDRGLSARENLPPGWSEQPEEVQTINLKDVACSARHGGLLKHCWQRAI